MSIRIIVVQAEGEGVAAALQLLANLATSWPGLVAAPAVEPPQARRPRQLPAPAQAGERNAAILEALKFRPLRVAEIADALCQDKRDVPVTINRLYPALAKMVAKGQIVRTGKLYALKGKR